MKIKIIGRGIEITDGLRQAVEDKLSKLEKYFVPDTEILPDSVLKRTVRRLR